MSELQRLYRALKASAISCQAEAADFRVAPDYAWGELPLGNSWDCDGGERYVRAKFCTRISRDSRRCNNGGEYYFYDNFILSKNGSVYFRVSASCDFWQPDGEDSFAVCLSEKGFNFLCWLAWHRAAAERRLAKKQEAGFLRPVTA